MSEPRSGSPRGAAPPARGRDTVASALPAHAARPPDAPFVAFERAPGEIESLSYGRAAGRAARTAGAPARLEEIFDEPRNARLQRSDVIRAFFIANGRRLLTERPDGMRT